MTIELDLMKIFAYASYMEFSHLSEDLLKLQIHLGVNCHFLDDARLDIFSHTKNHSSTQVSWRDLKPGHQYFMEQKPYKYELFEFEE
eukprot:3533970-Ditylum_brightwellii.AAC.1